MRVQFLATLFNKHRREVGITLISITIILLLSGYYYDVPRKVVVKLTGKEIEVGEDFRHVINFPIEDLLDSIRLFAIDPNDATRVLIKKGTYYINKTIVVPAGTHLTIERGSVLSFEEGVSLISYSPITARGTEDQPILFVAHNEESAWGVVGVVMADKSVFDHVRFENGNRALVNNQRFSGSLSLVYTDAEITNSEFVNLFGKDGVWVLKGNVRISGNVFKDNRGDCLDFDYGSGEISNNEFINCGDEGIDLMGNYDVEVFRNRIVSAGDKGIDADNYIEEIMHANSIE